jgi:transcriptional regulator GlxA family with amidase domain
LRALPQLLPEIPELLRRADDRGIPIIGLCTGTYVLAQAGILDGRRCALQFDTISEFAHRFPKARPVTEENYVIDRNVITGPGSIAAVDIAMILIEHYGNAGRARKALDYLLFKPKSASILSKHKPYQEALDTASKLTASAVAMMEVRIDSPCSIDELARTLNTNRVRLTRAFDADMKTSPALFWRMIRLLQSRELLYGSRRTITEIAYETGFSDTAHFCSSFRKHYGMTPQEFRKSRRPAHNGAGRMSWSSDPEED